MSTAYHKYNLWSESGFIFTCARKILQKVRQRWGRNWRHIVVILQKGSFQFFLKIKAAINKPVTKWLWFTYLQPAMFQVLLSSSLLRTRWLAVCSLLAANIKGTHTELISCGHLYNNTFAQSRWCSFDLEQWPILPFVWNMGISAKWPLDVVHSKKYALMTTVKHLIISHSAAC